MSHFNDEHDCDQQKKSHQTIKQERKRKRKKRDRGGHQDPDAEDPRGHKRPRHRRDEPRDSFRCRQCLRMVGARSLGTRHRNHCPCCLWSLHVDRNAGDRSHDCNGKMEPIAVEVRPDGEWALVHRCLTCTALKSNRIAGDDNEFVLMSLASKPIALPPFRLEALAKNSVRAPTKEDEE